MSTLTVASSSTVRSTALGIWRPRSPVFWTWIGGLAIPLWATWPSLSVLTRGIPPLECLALIKLVGWLAILLLERQSPAVTAPSQGWRGWIPSVVFALGQSGNAILFLYATRRIGAAEANLISYLWPGLTVAMGAALGIFRLRPRHMLGIALGFVGVALLFNLRDITVSYVGICLAFLAAVAWAAYCVFRLKWTHVTQPVLARGFGLSALICGACTLAFETPVMPPPSAALAAVAAAIIPGAIGTWAWDQGFRRGDSQLLAVMAYATPVCSAVLLGVLGLESMTWNLLIGALVIVAAGLLSRSDA